MSFTEYVSYDALGLAELVRTGAVSARELGVQIGQRTYLPVEYWDERMSTARALGAIREVGGSTRGRKEDVDSLAASVLLQHWLDARRSGGTAGGREE